MDAVDLLATEILKEKMRLEKDGKKPRMILLGEECFNLLEEAFIESIRELPWGDSLSYELQVSKNKGRDMFLGDGSMFGLWVVRVYTIKDFEVR